MTAIHIPVCLEKDASIVRSESRGNVVSKLYRLEDGRYIALLDIHFLDRYADMWMPEALLLPLPGCEAERLFNLAIGHTYHTVHRTELWRRFHTRKVESFFDKDKGAVVWMVPRIKG